MWLASWSRKLRGDGGHGCGGGGVGRDGGQRMGVRDGGTRMGQG